MQEQAAVLGASRWAAGAATSERHASAATNERRTRAASTSTPASAAQDQRRPEDDPRERHQRDRDGHEDVAGR